MEKSGIILVILISRLGLQAGPRPRSIWAQPFKPDLGLIKIGRESKSTKHALKT